MPKIIWPHKEADRILKRARDSGQEIIFETGYGPSGLPHIGTFAEVARTTFVIKALKRIDPDAQIRLIAFSDDMDGLRNVPKNVPNGTMLRDYLGKPLSSIPDPYEEQPSFAEYMNRQLQLFLDSFEFDYEFHSSTATYRAGAFDKGLKRIMDHYDQVRDIFVSTISSDKRDAWSPFFPICESCGRIYSTRVTGVDTKKYQLSYLCDIEGEGFKPCGHKATIKITGGAVKVGWKVDWALRWHTFGVNYEMHGKDLIESATVSSKICSIIGGRPPVLYKYELFLDEEGAKISKKIGNGISMEQWVRYSPLGGLLNFLAANPNKARRMGMPILPKIVDEYIGALKTENPEDPDSCMWFIDSVQHRHDASGISSSEISYNLLTNIAKSLSIHEPELLYQYMERYEPTVAENKPFFLSLCEKVVGYVKDYEEQTPQEAVEIDASFLPYGVELVNLLQDTEDLDDLDGEEIQALLFTIPKKYELNQREWFKFLYCILLGKQQGPRLGPLFGILGKETVLSKLNGGLEQMGITG